MIGCGKYRDVYLYEVTEQDLLLKEAAGLDYVAGNVLMFSDKRAIDLGCEFARADDLLSAREYLDQRSQLYASGDVGYEQELATLTSQVAQQDTRLSELSEQIALRDELLRDLTESLKSQRQDNELLHGQLVKAQKQLAVDELKQSELVDDLQHISSETYTIEVALERVMEEKFKLEQELAERITELVELNLQNTDLKKQLEKPGGLFGHSSSVSQPEPKSIARKRVVGEVQGGALESDTRVVTMASGKQIHILHEFPATPKRTMRSRAGRLAVSFLRICALALVATLVLGCVSVVATAQANDISLGAALDLIIGSLNLAM